MAFEQLGPGLCKVNNKLLLLLRRNHNVLFFQATTESPWVVSSADKLRYDGIFKQADKDGDGLVSGIGFTLIFLDLRASLLLQVKRLAKNGQQFRFEQLHKGHVTSVRKLNFAKLRYFVFALHQSLNPLTPKGFPIDE